MKYFSMFSGIGGFELGIARAAQDLLPLCPELKFECVGFSEIDKHAIQIYQSHFPKHRNYGDATTIATTGLPDFDLLVGGFPCQAFSIAGKRLGFRDTRGTLFFDIARVLQEKKPRNFVLENVRGLLSHDAGGTFRTIIGTLAGLGYCVEWQVLNSKDFNVPQSRERLYIVGHLGGIPHSEVFPIRQSGGPDHVLPAVTARYYGAQANGGYIGHAAQPDGKSYPRDGKCRNIAVPVSAPERADLRQNGRRFKRDGDPSFTLTCQDRHGVYDGRNIRRLTPVECERLQGFPDDWSSMVSEPQRYKCCGNAVTVTVVQAVMARLVESLIHDRAAAFSPSRRPRSCHRTISTAGCGSR